jgi:hypothetical protein
LTTARHFRKLSGIVPAETPHPAQLLGRDFSTTVLGVLFAFTIEKALESCLESVRSYPDATSLFTQVTAHPWVYAATLVQLLAFLATLFRFYAGSFRFHQEQPKKITDLGVLIDLGSTGILFSGFYIAALLVPTSRLFLAFVGLFHLIDLLWFVLSGVFTTYAPHVHKVLRHYLAYDVLTIAGVLIIVVVDAALSMNAETVQFFTSTLLFAMFGVDVLYHSRNWYFDPEKWRVDHS